MFLSLGILFCFFALHIPQAQTRVVDQFTENLRFFLNGKIPQLPGIIENGQIQDHNRFKAILQEYDNNLRFVTLYDTKNKIPVFSAYVYTGIGDKPTRSGKERWRIEPMLLQKDQALDEDYRCNNRDLSRGHLYPRCHANDKSDAISTFTLTNAVPQFISFNNGAWKKMEQNVTNMMDLSCQDNNKATRAYVITAAIPSDGDLLKDKVNIPSLMWTAFCCYSASSKSWIFAAHWANNRNDGDAANLTPKSLKELHDMLQNFYKGDISLFPDECLEAQKPKQDKHKVALTEALCNLQQENIENNDCEKNNEEKDKKDDKKDHHAASEASSKSLYFFLAVFSLFFILRPNIIQWYQNKIQRERESNEHIFLSVSDQNGGVMRFKMRRNKPLAELMKTYAERQHWTHRPLRLFYDGEHVLPTATPEQLNLENGEILDAFQEQVGGFK